MKGHMRSHIWMHVGLLAAIGAVFGLNVIGVAVPSVFVYLIVLACPLMMVFMMVGMGQGRDESEAGHAGSHDERGASGPTLEKQDVPR